MAIRAWRWQLPIVHRLGLALRWIVVEGRPALFGLVATAILLLALKSWFILAVYGLVLLAWLAFQARRRVVVAEFVDHTLERPGRDDEDKGKEPPGLKGVATLLVVELARLQRLYRVVDERRAIGTAVGEGRPLDATVKVESLSEILQSAVSAESKVSVGPITIPVGALMALLGRLVQGPQLTGALHSNGDSLILTAQLAGGTGRNHSWRVMERPISSADDAGRSPRVNEMVAELACRMFSDLTLGSSVNWRATEHFVKALRAFRRCLRVPRGRKLNLKEAERELIEAFSEDDGFVLVFYNLGVVYTELWRMALHEARAMKEAYDLRAPGSAEAKEVEAADQLHAAEAAFARAIDQDPGRWEAYYALGLTRFERGRRDSVIEQCERVLALHPSLANRAKAYDLKGLAEFRRKEPKLGDARASSQRAVKLSLRALRRAELFRTSAPGSETDPIPALKDQATRCLLNLAVVLAHEPVDSSRIRVIRPRPATTLRRLEAILGLALSLTNRDAVLHFEFGKIAERRGALDKAEREFKDATRIDPDQAAYWAHLAAVQAELFKRYHGDPRRRQQAKEAARHSCRRAQQAINLSSSTEEDRSIRASLAETYRRIGDKQDSQRIRAMGEFADMIGVYEWNLDVSPEDEHIVQDRFDDFCKQGRAWESGHLARLLGVARLNNGAPEEAETFFRRAIELFEGDHPEEIRRYGIRARLATAVAEKGGEQALAEAERALAVDPLRKLERKTLGQMYFGLRDYEHARAAWESALLWSPNDPELYWRLSECHRRLAEEERRPSERRSALEAAALHLEQALELYGGEGLESRLKTHYWLGRVYSDLGDFQKVIAHLRIVQSKAELDILADMLVGEAFLKMRGYEQAEAHFTKVIGAGEERLAGDAEATVGREVEDEIPVSLVVAWAYWGRAFSDAERDGHLDRADADVDAATALVDVLEQEAPSDGAAGIKLAPILRSCADCRGWIRFKQERLDEALDYLRQAILLGADSETYIRLALAYEAKATVAEADLRPALLGRARASCTHAIDTDVTGESRALVVEILARLGAESDPLVATSPNGAP
ncbi:MAG TPA: hypothetical protein VD769_05185 [Gaiellaceae bacterium]|nr:hypothetical protein [Gaiellaceae bacterium]